MSRPFNLLKRLVEENVVRLSPECMQLLSDDSTIINPYQNSIYAYNKTYAQCVLCPCALACLIGELTRRQLAVDSCQGHLKVMLFYVSSNPCHMSHAATAST